MNLKLANEIKVIGNPDLVPEVSVFLLTYNHSRFIRESLFSILKQKTDFPVEILVYDDCSTDDTLDQVLATNAPENICVRIFRAQCNLHQKNLGVYAAQQLVVYESRGKYIAHLERDDFYADEQKLQKQFDFMQQNQDVGFTFHDVVKISETGQFVEGLIPQVFKRNYTQDELKNFQFAYIHASSVFWKKSLDAWPPEVFCCTNNTDMLLPYIWACSGRAVFMSEIKPNRYRQTAYGIWSSADFKRKLQLKLQTSLLMISLHLRHGNLTSAKNVLVQRAVAQINTLFN